MTIEDVVKARAGIVCDESEFRVLMEQLDRIGYTWAHGEKPQDYNPFEDCPYLDGAISIFPQNLLRESSKKIIFNDAKQNRRKTFVSYTDVSIPAKCVSAL